jgi:hypothetical protein
VTGLEGNEAGCGPATRKNLNGELAKEGNLNLSQSLVKLDPKRARKTDCDLEEAGSGMEHHQEQ